MASLVLTDSSHLTSDSQHLGIYISPMASLVLTDSSQLTSNSQHLGIYSSPIASLVLTDSSQLTSDTVSCQSASKKPRGHCSSSSDVLHEERSALLSIQDIASATVWNQTPAA
uniref:Uncharacterized protein n=1 Tax=Timema shepardi TaxID=629360 RepID=A0A7R9FXT7_TIMSH|nr:unnamed protein product [Timema shepardi]